MDATKASHDAQSLPLVAPGAEAQAWQAGIPLLLIIAFGIIAAIIGSH